jgi:multidrug resistance efflux pump
VVRRGDVLVRLDTERLDNEIARRRRAIAAGEEELARLARVEELAARQAEAARAKAEAELDQARDEVLRARRLREVETRLAGLDRDRAADELGRLRRLADRRAAAEAEVFQAAVRALEAEQRLEKARLPVDEGRVEVLRRALALAGRDEAVRREEAALKRSARVAEVEADRLALANLALERAQAVLKAPIDGVVTAGDVRVGDLLERGKPVLEVAEQAGFRFEAAVPSDQVARLRVGMPARVKLDAYDYQRYGTASGTVCFVSPDSGVARGQATATYSVRIALDRGSVGRNGLRGPIKLGMAGSAEIVTGRESLLRLLVTRIRQTISLG